MMITQTPKNIHKIFFQAILMTSMCDLKIDLTMFEPHRVQ